MIDQFRGIPLVALSELIQVAAANGGVRLLKMVQVRENHGKSPELALAEQMIAALNRPPPGEMFDG
jgi:hypothetical protein